MSKSLELERYYSKRGLKSNKKKSNSDYLTTADVFNNKEVELKSFSDLYDNNITEFFERIDSYNGFFSTQQIESLDYSKFEEHVFFDSAIEKVNYSFSKILNEYPYDGTKYEVDQFLKGLDGYTKYILDNKVNKNIGYLRFDGSTYVSIVDRNGHLLNDYDNEVKIGILDPEINEFSFDFWINPLSDNITNKQIIFQKLYIENNKKIGYTIYVEENSADKCNIVLKITKYNDVEKQHLISKAVIDKNTFQHVNFSVKNSKFQNKNLVREIKFYLNGKIKNSESTGSLSVDTFDDDLNFANRDITIGHGNAHNINSENDTYTGFVGLIDEFRYYIDSKRNANIIAYEKNENVFAKESLKLYLKFNETNLLHSNNQIVLDSSGNKLHGFIYNTDNDLTNEEVAALRSIYNNIQTPLKYEKINLNPVLFSFSSNATRLDLLEKAEKYDLTNPNSFWKMMPKNIFIEGSDFDNVEEIYGSKKTSDNSDVMGMGKSASQTLIKIMTIWARFFDELKSYIDTFSEILNVDYDTVSLTKKNDGIILPLALKTIGVNFREILPFPILEKLENKNLTHEEVISDISIRQIQNNLWKRFLINSKDYLSSKGTHNSIKSTFNAFGLDADRFLRIREDTGKNNLNIDNQFYRKNKNIKRISFNKRSNFNLENITYNSDRLPENSYVFKTNIFNSTLLDLSKDWSIECFYKFDAKDIEKYSEKQSLLRVDLKDTGLNNFAKPYINIVFERNNKLVQNGNIYGYINTDDSNNNVKILEISNISLLNGFTYYLCLNKTKDIKSNQFIFNLTVGNTSDASYSGTYKTNSYFDSTNYRSNTNIDTQIIIGNYSYTDTDAPLTMLSNLSYDTNFNGEIFNFRIYDKALSLDEMLIKKKNITNIATNDYENSLKNLLLNISLETDLSSIIYDGDAQTYNLYSFINKAHEDNSNKLNAVLYTGNLGDTKPFSISKEEILIQNYDIDFIHTHNKININSFEADEFKKEHKNANLTNLPDVSPEFLYSNDLRLSIDFSSVSMLNEEISKIILINDYFTNKLTITSNLYEIEYKSLDNLRNVYFERLSEDIDMKYLYQVYKYFDNILEELLYDAIPSKVNYLGFNYVFESHILERNKYQYKMLDSILPAYSNDASSYQKYSAINKNYKENFSFTNPSNKIYAGQITKKRLQG